MRGKGLRCTASMMLSIWTSAICTAAPSLNRVRPSVFRRTCAVFGISGTVAARILDLRDILGHFESARQLPLLPGISKKNAEKLAQLFPVVVNPDALKAEPRFRVLERLRGTTQTVVVPCRLNRAGPRSLSGLPGMDRKLAEAVIRYRKKFGPFRFRWSVLAVPGITPGIYARIRDHLVTGPEKTVVMDIAERCHYRNNGSLRTSSEFSLRVGTGLSARYLMKTQQPRETLFRQSPANLNAWRINCNIADCLFLRAGRIRPESDLFLTGIWKKDGADAGMPSFNTTIKKIKREQILSTTGYTVEGARIDLPGRCSHFYGIISSKTFKANYEDDLSWTRTGENMGRLFQAGFSAGSKKWSVGLCTTALVQSNSRTSILGTLTGSASGRKTRFTLSYAAGMRAPYHETVNAWMASFSFHGHRYRGAMTFFFSGQGFRPLLEEERGTTLFPGKGLMAGFRYGTRDKSHFRILWTLRRMNEQQNARNNLGLETGIPLAQGITAGLEAAYGDRTPEAAEIWAPCTVKFRLSRKSVFGTEFRSRFLLAPGKKGTGTALETRFGIPLGRDLRLILWAAGGKPVSGSPLSLLPPGIPEWISPVRNCFRPFRAATLSVRFSSSDTLSLNGSLSVFRDNNTEDISLRLQTGVHL